MRDEGDESGFAAVKNHAEQAILEAEKFKAKIASPPGRINLIDDCNVLTQQMWDTQIGGVGTCVSGNSDDNFFPSNLPHRPSTKG